MRIWVVTRSDPSLCQLTKGRFLFGKGVSRWKQQNLFKRIIEKEKVPIL